jgi:DNA-binding Xre family transcriptional regulator
MITKLAASDADFGNSAVGGGRAVSGNRAVSVSDRPASADRFEYEMARLPRDVTTAITWFMKENKVSQADLAKELKVTPGRVSQILSGDENLTLRTLAAVCVALDAHFELELVSNTDATAGWNDVPVPVQPVAAYGRAAAVPGALGRHL